MSFLLSISMISNFSGSILNLASTWFDILCVLCVFVENLLGLFAVRAIALWDHQHRLGLDQLIHLSLNSGHLRIWKLWDLAPHSSTSRCESDTHQLQHEEFFVTGLFSVFSLCSQPLCSLFLTQRWQAGKMIRGPAHWFCSQSLSRCPHTKMTSRSAYHTQRSDSLAIFSIWCI